MNEEKNKIIETKISCLSLATATLEFGKEVDNPGDVILKLAKKYFDWVKE